mgnify:FL=1
MAHEVLTEREFNQAADYIRSRTRHRPQVGIILGSGLGQLAEEVQEADVLPYPDIPHFPTSTIEGHAGRLVIGYLSGCSVWVMQGRAHYYEGYSMQRITLPVRVMQVMGIHTLFVTNAAGGLNPDFKAGEVMLITDHINLVGMAGLNPLRGPNLEQFGTRFPDMSQAYDPHLQAIARQVARRLGIPLQEGIYVSLAGPSFETPAEIRFLRGIGGDAVGMSTAPEVIVARHGAMRVLGLSGISNQAFSPTSPGQQTTHAEVLEAGKLIAPRLIQLIKGVLAELVS